MEARELWTAALNQARTLAREKLGPTAEGRISRGYELAYGGCVEIDLEGTCTVQDGDTLYLVNGRCECGLTPADGLCDHKMAVAMVKRARELVKTIQAPTSTAPTTRHATAGLERYLVEIQGRQFVTFHGLLHLAHQQGLVSLAARFISVAPELALAEATATFQDGRIFTEAADATPGNVNARIRPHFPRMALTRAKARALRDALDIDYVCAAELGEEDAP